MDFKATHIIRGVPVQLVGGGGYVESGAMLYERDQLGRWSHLGHPIPSEEVEILSLPGAVEQPSLEENKRAFHALAIAIEANAVASVEDKNPVFEVFGVRQPTQAEPPVEVPVMEAGRELLDPPPARRKVKRQFYTRLSEDDIAWLSRHPGVLPTRQLEADLATLRKLLGKE